MLLAFDVGNTNIVCGVYKDRKLIKNWRIATDTLQTADGYVALLGTLFHLNQLEFDDVEDIIISTVVPPIIPILETMSHRYFHVKPILVGPGIKTGLNILYDNPKELGADRIVNAVAAIAEYDCPLIIIDMGTATTFCVIDTKGNYLGGAVAPGIGIHGSSVPESIQAPAHRTRQDAEHHLPQYRIRYAGRHLLRICRTD